MRYFQIPWLERYAITDTGLLVNMETGTVRRPWVRNGYLSVRVRKDGWKVNLDIHRLVAEAFVPRPRFHRVQCYVNHIDGDKFNNHHSNLEWVTPSQNTRHYYRLLGKSIKISWHA